MTKKKKTPDADAPAVPPQLNNPLPPGGHSTTKITNGKVDQQHSSLTISRNKHWRYISAFHGPWLQLPHEILETLAHTNYLSPRPRQTDPGVLYDLLKIRKLVDEASDLAVRAQNGTASSALANADNGLPGSALGLSYRGGGGNAKLSPERKYRMRELATQKLSQAYRLDEVAASVATMQSASTLDSVASLVLQRSPGNTDAKYVHFFHEKIPSRMMAECTPLTPLNEVIAFEQGHAAPYRTRALTRIFKEDYVGAVRDLTEALQLCRTDQAKHKAGKNQLVTLKAAREEAEKRRVWTRDWMQDNKVAEEDQPRGLEMQLLFQRGNQYLTMACQYIRIALEQFKMAQRKREQDLANVKSDRDPKDAPFCKSSEEMEAYARGLEAREMVRKNAKRALRDYTTFFSFLDYAHAPADEADGSEYGRNGSRAGNTGSRDSSYDRTPEASNHSTALVRQSTPHRRQQEESPRRSGSNWSSPPIPIIHDISMLLSASPPVDLPPFPPQNAQTLVIRSSSSVKDTVVPQHTEMITYHPLMPETMHSLLLTHCLLQTPPTTLLRLSNNVARLARLADGYPFFLSARSPARADWSEIVRKTGNWIGLSATWESLCKVPQASAPAPASSPAPPPAQKNGLDKEVARKATAPAAVARPKVDEETKDQRRDRIHKEAVMEALGDERVVDDDTFQRAVEAREKRAWRDFEAEERGGNALTAASAAGIAPFNINGPLSNNHAEKPPPNPHTRPTTTTANTSTTNTTSSTNPPNPSEPLGRGRNGHVAKDEEYLIGTERAEAIARWVLEAPTVVEAATGGKPSKRKKKAGGAGGAPTVAIAGGGGKVKRGGGVEEEEEEEVGMSAVENRVGGLRLED